MKGVLAMSYKQMILKLTQPADLEDLEGLTDTEFQARLIICKLLDMPEEQQGKAAEYLLNVFDHIKNGVYDC